MSTRALGMLRMVGPPALFGAAMFGLWQFVVRFFDLKPYFLVPPSAIWSGFIHS